MPSKPFQPGHEAVVERALTFAGVRYERGARFPYRDLGIIDFDLRGLWVAELIEFTPQQYDAELERLTAPAARPRQQPPARR